MDLSAVKQMTLHKHPAFESPEIHDGQVLEHEIVAGYFLRLEIRQGEFHYSAHDGKGQQRVVFHARLSPNDRCFACVCSDDMSSCECVETPCPVPKKK